MNDQQPLSLAPTSRLIRLGDGAFITVVINGESLTVRAQDSQASFDKALEAYKASDWDALYTAMRPVKAYCSKVDGVTVTDKGVFLNDEPVHNTIATRIMEFAMSGLDHQPLCRFLEKLSLNPSRRAVNELYTFLEHQNLPITDNGNFLAYKGLRGDYYSVHTGTSKLIQGKSVNGKIYNGIGEIIEMKRNDVDDDKDRGCSYGLHAGTMEYATQWAQGKCVIVEINPSDVVSIPTDCNFQKLRTCKYKVVGEFESALSNPCYESRWTDYDGYDSDCVDVAGDDYEFFTEGSTWIDCVAFVDGNLLIDLTNGEVMEYFDVPFQVFLDFENWVNQNKSAGQFYHKFIKDKY
jgi:hypothetical protein